MKTSKIDLYYWIPMKNFLTLFFSPWHSLVQKVWPFEILIEMKR